MNFRSLTLNRFWGAEQTPRVIPAPSTLARQVASLLLFLAAGLMIVRPCAGESGVFYETGSLATGRSEHTTTLLPNGKVLVAGGTGVDGNSLASAELYNPANGTWTATAQLATARSVHTATLLPNGQVLVAGGIPKSMGGWLASAELYDPATGTWTETGHLTVPRFGHTATLLPNGQVLVAGGPSIAGDPQSAELYDPASGTWAKTGRLATGRGLHTATLLPNGKVLVAGGLSSSGYVASAELYDFTSGTWTATAQLAIGRYEHTAILLPIGKLLVAGGSDTSGFLTSAELYDQASGNWTATGSLATARGRHAAALLPANGKVLAAGGVNNTSNVGSAELFDPVSSTWMATGSLVVPRSHYTATLLPNGKVLVAGGEVNGTPSASAELYDPAATPTATPTPSPIPGTSFTPGMHDFGSVMLGSSSNPFVFTVHNNQAAPALGLSYSLSGTGAASFSITSNNCGSTLPVGGSCTLSVTFSPVTVGPKTASLDESSSNAGSPHASLTGTGTPSTPTPTPGPVTHFAVIAPGVVFAGFQFGFTITAQDQFNNTATNYAGTVHFTTTSPHSQLPPDSTLINGAATLSAWLNTTGNQTITATDTSNASITGTSNTILVEQEEPPPSPTPPAPPAQPINLSTRLRVEAGVDNAGIGGFIITGSVPKEVLLRAIGPSTGVANSLADPTLALHGGGGFTTIVNDNWKIRFSDGTSQQAEIEATGIAPTNDLESAIHATLAPGAYTAILRGNGIPGTGVALVEIYDLAAGAASKLGDISTRAFVGTGNDIVIAGFILGNNSGNDRTVVRGLGPSLAGSGLGPVLADPILELRNSDGALVDANDNCGILPPLAPHPIELSPQPNPLEACMDDLLSPGAYTALLSGRNNGTGLGLVEVYDNLFSGPTPTPSATATPTATPASGPLTATNLSAPETYLEDNALNLTDIVVSDTDSTTVTATLTISNIAAGRLSTATSGTVTSTYDAVTGVWTASGAIVDVNTLLAGVTFIPSANFNANFTIATSVSDGVAAALTGSKATTGIAVNDQPWLPIIDPLPPIPINSGLQTFKIHGLSAGPPDESTQTLTVTATSNNPGLIPNPTVTYTSPSDTFTLSYTPVAGQSGTAQITITIMDDGGVLNGGVDTLTRMFPVFVSPP